MDTCHAIRRNLLTASAVMLTTCGIAVGWGVSAPLEGAVVSSGTVVVEDSVKKIQHPTGGIVGEIRVREGASVAAGDILVRLDETAAKASLGIIQGDLIAQRARLARLHAMRDGQTAPVFPDDLTEAARTDPAIATVIDGEARLCRFTLTTRQEQKQQLHERIVQLQQEIRGLEEQAKSTEAQARIAKAELDDLQPLLSAGNVQRPRVSALEREVLRHQGLLGEANAKIAQSRAKISETELQIVQNGHDFMAEIIKDTREAENRISELSERRVAAEDQLKRLDIRAPIAGNVHQLAVHTIGGVISPSEPLMLIVPTSGELIVEAHISPADIDQISLGQETRVRFSAFNRRTTEEVSGTVSRLAADLTSDPRTNQSYYTAGVSIPEAELVHLDGHKLMPGMPAEVFIKTGERTLASYLFKPLGDQMQRAFRER